MLNLLKTTITYRELLINLTLREIKARYKQSILGYFWVILNPFFQMIVMAFVFSTILRLPLIGVPYPIFLYIGLLPWTLFSNSISSSINSLVDSSSLIKKIYFPREVLPLATTLAKIVDFFLASTILILFMVFFHLEVNIMILWFIPIFLIQLIFTFGLSLILSAVNLFYRDIQYLVNLILLLWFYLTPVIYPVELFPEKYRFIFKLNPIAVLVNAYRQTILGGGMPNLNSLSVALLLSIIVLAIGYTIFKKMEGVFADVV